MRRFLQIAQVIVVALFTSMFWSCERDPGGLTYQEVFVLDRLDRMEKEIIEMIGDASCDGVESCRFIAFGDKPCGGPWKYLIYSIANVDTTVLQQKVSAYNMLNAEANERFRWGSDCGFEVPPNLGCKEGKCSELRWDELAPN